MKRLSGALLGVLLLSSAATNALGWGVYHGPNGGAAYRGPMGGAAVRGPGGAAAVRGPYGAGAYRGPYGGAGVRGPYGGAAVRGPYGGTAYRAPYYGGTVYRGGTYYGGTTVVTPGVGAGVAAGVAVGAAATSAAAASAYAAQSYNYYPPPYYTPLPTGTGGQPSQAQTDAIRQACRNDYMAHCSAVRTGGPAALSCLQQNATSLSQHCQQALSVTAP